MDTHKIDVFLQWIATFIKSNNNKLKPAFVLQSTFNDIHKK